MFPRVLLYGYLINPALLSLLLWPMLLMMLALYLPAGFMLYRHRGVAVEHPALASNPLELRSAMILGALVVVILLLAEWLREGMGDQGMYLLAAVSGVTDIDAITLSLARLSLTDTFHTEAIVVGIFIAANMNNLFKTLLAFSIGKAALGIKVGRGDVAGSVGRFDGDVLVRKQTTGIKKPGIARFFYHHDLFRSRFFFFRFLRISKHKLVFGFVFAHQARTFDQEVQSHTDNNGIHSGFRIRHRQGYRHNTSYTTLSRVFQLLHAHHNTDVSSQDQSQ